MATNKTVRLIDDEDARGTRSFDEFVTRMVDLRDSIAPEHRATATIEFDAWSFYDDSTPEIEMTVEYVRPETAAERKAREDFEAMYAAAEEQRRRFTAAAQARAAWQAAWWADRDPVNYATFAEALRGIWPDIPELGCRQAFHHEAERVKSGAAKPHWWRELETAEG